MKRNRNKSITRAGFTLAEILATTIIGSMVLIAVLTIYNRVERTAAALTRTLNNTREPDEVLQLIAEDFDKVINTDSETSMILANRYTDNYSTALLLSRTTYKDATDKEQQFEELIWQCTNEVDANNMVLYRSYEGIVPEDRLLDRNKDEKERSSYVPICSGVTFFDVEIFAGKEETMSVWPNGVPLGITITISFAKPYKDAEGHYEVLENEKYSRTIAFDKSRKIKFNISDEESSNDQQNTTEVKIKDDTDSESTKPKK